MWIGIGKPELIAIEFKRIERSFEFKYRLGDVFEK